MVHQGDRPIISTLFRTAFLEIIILTYVCGIFSVSYMLLNISLNHLILCSWEILIGTYRTLESCHVVNSSLKFFFCNWTTWFSLKIRDVWSLLVKKVWYVISPTTQAYFFVDNNFTVTVYKFSCCMCFIKSCDFFNWSVHISVIVFLFYCLYLFTFLSNSSFIFFISFLFLCIVC